MMQIVVQNYDFHVLNMRTRMPFRYGIATLTALPHLFVRLGFEFDGRMNFGIASEGLPPKWFTKNPETPFKQDLEDMLRVIRSACGIAVDVGLARSPFRLWEMIYEEQERWGAEAGFPPLLWNLGVSLVERAVYDGFCRTLRIPFSEALRQNALGIELGDIHGELAGKEPSDFLPSQPLRTVRVRHTVGLADPLTERDIPEGERLADGLPQSLEECIRTYGLNRFKIKLCGDAGHDTERLLCIADTIERHVPEYAFTLDGNEQFREVEPFREFWTRLHAVPRLKTFLAHLIFVEQPMHREFALRDGIRLQLASWKDRPPMIIDESDSLLDSALEALSRGYCGTSHKNCKGIVKGIANACLIESRRQGNPEGRFILSGEDLANVGPVALLQDLSLMANLGIEHVERNGHHYFTGLSMYPNEIQSRVLQVHGDLYRRHEAGYPTLDIRDGFIQLDSVIHAPFGVGLDLDVSRFTPLDAWTFESLEC